jgi:hypothetical protein
MSYDYIKHEEAVMSLMRSRIISEKEHITFRQWYQQPWVSIFILLVFRSLYFERDRADDEAW